MKVCTPENRNRFSKQGPEQLTSQVGAGQKNVSGRFLFTSHKMVQAQKVFEVPSTQEVETLVRKPAVGQPLRSFNFEPHPNTFWHFVDRQSGESRLVDCCLVGFEPTKPSSWLDQLLTWGILPAYAPQFQQPDFKLSCSRTWLLSPPKSGSPQVTTAPDSRTAAKARWVAWMLRTFLSWSCTWLLSPPYSA